MKFGDLIIKKIFKFVATKCQILRLNIQIQLQRSQDLLFKFNGRTSKGLEQKRWEHRSVIRKGKKAKRWGSQGSVHIPVSEILKKYHDCRTDLIGGGGNTDVCPGRQTPSRRH